MAPGVGSAAYKRLPPRLSTPLIVVILPKIVLAGIDGGTRHTIVFAQPFQQVAIATAAPAKGLGFRLGRVAADRADGRVAINGHGLQIWAAPDQAAR